MRYEFNITKEQEALIHRCINAVEAYRRALTSAFLTGKVSFETKTTCDLFFTLKTFESMLTGYCWDMDIQQLDIECKTLDDRIAVCPEEFVSLQKELEEINRVFKDVAATASPLLSINE